MRDRPLNGLAGPARLAVDTNDNLYVANYDNSSIVKLDAAGTPSVFASTGLSSPTCVAFDHSGQLYAANYGNNTIVKFDVNRTLSTFATSGLSAPTSMAFDGSGNLYVANSGNNTVVKFDTNGTPSTFASNGLNTPYGLAVARIIPIGPAITTPPVSQAVYAGQGVFFSVVATGYPLLYQWRKDGVDLAGATSATYSLPFALTNHAGSYTVVVSNSGSVTSAPPALLTVIAVAPEITTSPMSQTVNEWQSANFTVVATGHPAPNYQWRKEGVDIRGATSATFSLSFVRPNQAGNYTVVVSNSAGSVTSAPPAVMTVNPRPLFFTNFAAIEIWDDAPANPYPSTITVSGVTNLIANINVTLYEMSHTYASDISVLLVGPNGQTVVLMSNAGEDLGDTTLVFDDGATNFLPVASRIFSGTYKPTDYYTNGGFYPPAPSRPYGSALSVFNGTDPNGVWKLFVIDTEGEDIGRIAGGWAISMSGDDSAGALRFTWDSGHKLLLEFSAVSNKTYTLQYRDKIGTGSWSNLLDFTSASTNRTVSFTNAMPPGATARYNRLVTPRQSGK